MAEQASATFAEKNAALRRGTRNRIAKRRPDFVDPFSLRKKRKTKAEGDELLSALSPCSEEGIVKAKPPLNLSSLDCPEKKNSSSSFERDAISSAEVHSLPTSNPKVRVIIRRKPDVPDSASLKLVPNEKPSIKLRIRIKPPTPKLGPEALEPSSTCGELEHSDTGQISGSKVRNRKDVEPGEELRKCPRKVITKLKLLVSPTPVEQANTPRRETRSVDRSKRKISETNKESPRKKQKLEAVEALEPPLSNQSPIKISTPTRGGAKGSEKKQKDVVTITLRRRPKSAPQDVVKEVKRSAGTGQKHKQEMENERSAEESKQNVKTPKLDMNLHLRANLLPLRKRPYMREGRSGDSPMLRRSTRNRQKRGHSR